MIVRSVTRFLGPILLLAAIVIGDQIRIHRPDHKFRLVIEVSTPAGVRTGSGVFSVHPDRGYAQGNATITKGDAIVVDLGGRPLILLMAHDTDGKFVLDDFNFVAVRAFTAAGQRASFRRMDRLTGAVPVADAVMPALATLGNASDPATMIAVKPDDFAAAFGAGVSLRAVRVEIVPNGYWPMDFGGALGEPVTRDILRTLPWAKSPEATATALKAAGWPPNPGDDARMAFMR